MRFIASETGENPDVIANVSYVPTASDGVYIASEVFDGYRDLFVDAHLAYHLPTEEPLKDTVPNWKVLPQHRPSYLQHDPAIDVMIRTGRYQDLTVGLALRAIPDDPDLHYENIGAVPIKRSGPKIISPLSVMAAIRDLCFGQRSLITGSPLNEWKLVQRFIINKKCMNMILKLIC